MVAIENGPVKPHVQAFADAVNEKFGTILKTYNGHSPDRTLALDCWDSLEDRRKVAQFAQENVARYGVDYVIHEQKIWNPDVSPSWRAMEDRGDPTQNHFDHVHISFIQTAPVGATTTPDQEDPFMAMTDAQVADMLATLREIKDGVTKDQPGVGGIAGTVEALSNTVDRIEGLIMAMGGTPDISALGKSK